MQAHHGRMTKTQFQTMMQTGVKPTVYTEPITSVDDLLDSIALDSIASTVKTISKIEVFKARAKDMLAKQRILNSFAPPKTVQWRPCGICGEPLCPLGFFE